MSLDNRLRQGLKTLDEPTGDSARELEKFRTTAYPRRARRRIVQGAIGTLAAAAVIAGVTTAVVSSARKAPNFITPPPVNVPACQNGETQVVMSTAGPVVSGRSKAYYVSISVFTTGKACRIDETFAPKITANMIEYRALNGGDTAPLLTIQGNESKGRLLGIVPAASEKASLNGKTSLSISWAWTNWCGPDRSFSVNYKLIAGSTHTLDTLEGTIATIPTVPTCNDRSAPSVLKVTPVALVPFPPVNPSSLIDLNPRAIAPRAGLTNLNPVYIDQVIVSPDGKTLLVSFVHGDQCSLFARVDVQETAQNVRITPYVGDLPGGPSCTGTGYAGDAARIVLKRALGNRHIVNGVDPSYTVPIAHQTRR